METKEEKEKANKSQEKNSLLDLKLKGIYMLFLCPK